jgi:hypothetical protein
MKAKLPLILSFALNVFLAGLYWLRPAEVVKVVEREPAARAVSAPTNAVKIETNRLVIVRPAELLNWRHVESEDYKKYVANLRLVGCPEKTIRDIIVADVNELYRQRFKEIFPQTNQIEYWKSGDPYANLIDETHVAKLHEFATEKRELIRNLLGTDFSDEVDLSSIQMETFMERLLNFLPPQKRDTMKDLEQKYLVKMMKTMKDSVRGDNTGRQALLAEKSAAMLEVLTPEEKFEYDLRRSEESMYMRVGLRDFELSEQEFRAMFPPFKKFMDVAGTGGYGALIRDEEDPRDDAVAARKELEKALQSALGAERFRIFTEETGWGLHAEKTPVPEE